MLRSFTTDIPYRSLAMEPFKESELVSLLGKNTLIYGQNGAGKTSFSELLRQSKSPATADGCTVTASLRIDNKNTTREVSSPNFPLNFAVYNRYYVAGALELFLEGEGTSDPIPVLRIGESNVATERSLRRLKSLLSTRKEWYEKATNVEKQSAKDEKRVEAEIKALVIQALNQGAADKYNSATYRVTQVRKNLQNASLLKVLGENGLETTTNIACEPSREVVSVPDGFPQVSDDFSQRIHSVLTRDVESQVIPALAGDQRRSTWVEDGLKIHSPGDECKFCQDGTVSGEIFAAYRRHFSDALEQLQIDLVDAHAEVEGQLASVKGWFSNLPEPSELLFEFQTEYNDALKLLVAEAETFNKNRTSLLQLIEKRQADLLVPLVATDGLEPPADSPEAEKLLGVLSRNNLACDTQSEKKALAQQAVEDHYASIHAEEYFTARSLGKRAGRAKNALERNLKRMQQDYDQLLLSQQDTGPMALRIDSDLRSHFGHGHLSVTQSDDGKGYVVKRGQQIATDLSEGERNAIAYLYFLASLEADSVDKANTVVVIDDPVTSLDRESLFAAFGVQTEYLEDFGQTIFLTHDYEFFRLQASHLENRYKKSQRRIRDGVSSEIEFPKVSILEIKPKLQGDNQRMSSLRPLSQELLWYSSEYHYLFFKVVNAIRTRAHDEFPLLGNAARRLIEGFIAFQAPHENSFGGRVSGIAHQRGVAKSLVQRVVKFMHGQSHRTSPSPATGLDFPAIEDELSAVITFMREADEQHFLNMCKAVKVDPNDFSPRELERR